MRKIIPALLLCVVLFSLCSCISFSSNPPYFSKDDYTVTVSSSSLAQGNAETWGTTWK